MDFDKEAREICAPLLNPEPHPFQSEWSDIHSMCTCDLLTNIERALRRAFLAGQESMRERASAASHTAACGMLSDRNFFVIHGPAGVAQSMVHAINTLPLLEEPNKEVAG